VSTIRDLRVLLALASLDLVATTGDSNKSGLKTTNLPVVTNRRDDPDIAAKYRAEIEARRAANFIKQKKGKSQEKRK
jgi:hypothetical protein